MEIRFVSSLTGEDESLLAPALIRVVGALLDQMPIAYNLRIETTGAQVYQCSRPTGIPSEGLNPVPGRIHSQEYADRLRRLSRL